MINTVEILKKVYERLEQSSELAAFVEGRIYNWSIQDDLYPFVRASIANMTDFDDKTTLGFDVMISVDVWSRYKGDGEVLQITDIIKNLFHRNEFSEMSFQNVNMVYDNASSFIEPDRETTHTNINFRSYFIEQEC